MLAFRKSQITTDMKFLNIINYSFDTNILLNYNSLSLFHRVT